MIRVKEIYQAVINRTLSWTTDHNFMSRGRSSSSTTIQLRITLIQINHERLTRVVPSATFAFSFFFGQKRTGGCWHESCFVICNSAFSCEHEQNMRTRPVSELDRPLRHAFSIRIFIDRRSMHRRTLSFGDLRSLQIQMDTEKNYLNW